MSISILYMSTAMSIYVYYIVCVCVCVYDEYIKAFKLFFTHFLTIFYFINPYVQSTSTRTTT